MAQYAPYDQQQSGLGYQPVLLSDPAHSLAPSTAGTPTKEGPYTSPDGSELAREKAESQRPTWTIILYSLLVIILTAGPAIVLLAYIFIVHDSTRDGGVIETTADLQNLLTISQVLTTVVSRTVPVVMTVHAYQLAANWIKASRQASAGRNRPTPLQLGLLISILQGANILAWGKSQFFLAGVTKDSKRHTLSTAAILRKAIFVLGILLFISNIVAGFDTWLHVTSSAVPITLTSTYPPTGNTLFSRQLNQTRCEYFDTQPGNVDGGSAIAALCGLETNGADGGIWNSIPEGLRTLTGSSENNAIAFTDDNHAIIVPPSTPQGITYEGKATGVQTTCASMTEQCIVKDQFGSWGSGIAPNLGCTGSPRLNISAASIIKGPMGYPAGVVDPSTGNIATGENWSYVKTNPFPVGFLITSMAYWDVNGLYYDNATGTDWVGNTGFFSIGSMGGWQVLYCNVTVNDVQYSFSNSNPNATNQYHTISTTPSSVQLASFIGLTLDLEDNRLNPYLMTHVPDAVDGTGLEAGNYAEAFSKQLSRQMLGLSASIYEAIPADNIQTAQEILGSRIKVLPLALYVLLTLVYSLVTLIIMIGALVASRNTPYVPLAHFRITSPLAFVHALFGPVEGARTWKEDGIGIFSTESEADRLVVGPIAAGRTGAAYGVTRLM